MNVIIFTSLYNNKARKTMLDVTKAFYRVQYLYCELFRKLILLLSLDFGLLRTLSIGRMLSGMDVILDGFQF